MSGTGALWRLVGEQTGEGWNREPPVGVRMCVGILQRWA